MTAATATGFDPAYERARTFFHACESAQGWSACQPYVANGAVFSAQSEPIADFHTVAEYCEWMRVTGTVVCPGATYELKASGYDEASRTAFFFAVYHAKHTGEGGPVPPTGLETHSEYVYILTMDADERVERMTKVWNAPWAMRELGWA